MGCCVGAQAALHTQNVQGLAPACCSIAPAAHKQPACPPTWCPCFIVLLSTSGAVYGRLPSALLGSLLICSLLLQESKRLDSEGWVVRRGAPACQGGGLHAHLRHSEPKLSNKTPAVRPNFLTIKGPTCT